MKVLLFTLLCHKLVIVGWYFISNSSILLFSFHPCNELNRDVYFSIDLGSLPMPKKLELFGAIDDCISL